MQLHFKEKKKKEAAGRFGGRAGNLKLTPKVFFSFFLSFFFVCKAVKCRERISGSVSPPRQSPLQEFWEKVNCQFPQSCGGQVEVGVGGLGGPGNVFWKGPYKNGIVRNYSLRFRGEGWQ